MEGHDNDQAVLKQLDRLATEMSTQRKLLELLGDRIIEQGEPIDYSADIGGLSKSIGSLIMEMDALKESPAFAKNGERILGIIKAGTRDGISSAVRDINTGVHRLADISSDMGRVLENNRTWREQEKALMFQFWGGALLGTVMVGSIWGVWSLLSEPTDADAAWAHSREGRDARALAQLNDPSLFLECRGASWTIKTSVNGRRICVGDGTRGWLIP